MAIRAENGFWPLAKADLRHNGLFRLVPAVGLLALCPVLFGLTALPEAAVWAPLELLAALTGIVLLTPLFTPEQSAPIRETVAVRPVSLLWVYALRLAYSLVFLVLALGGLCLLLRAGGCAVTPAHFAGTLAEALFLGALGLAASAVTGNGTLGYMLPMLYYAINYAGGASMGALDLFAGMRGHAETKVWLAAAGALLLAAGFAAQWRRTYRR